MNCRLVPVSTGISEPLPLKEGTTTFGRDSDNNIQLMSEFVSRHQAKINNMPSVCVIEDLNSSNGIFVNNNKITTYNLRTGDEIRLGDIIFRFEECLSESSEDLLTIPREYSDRAFTDTVRIMVHKDDVEDVEPLRSLKIKRSTLSVRPLKPKSD
ncbi:FHA domain-containing protein [Verrucomicrobiota bacterium]